MILEDLDDGDATISWVIDPILLGQQLGNAMFLGAGLDLFDIDHSTAFLMGSVHKFGARLSSYQCDCYDDWARPLPVKVRHLHTLTDSFPIAAKKVSNPVEVAAGVRIPPFRAFCGGLSTSSRCS